MGSVRGTINSITSVPILSLMCSSSSPSAVHIPRLHIQRPARHHQTRSPRRAAHTQVRYGRSGRPRTELAHLHSTTERTLHDRQPKLAGSCPAAALAAQPSAPPPRTPTPTALPALCAAADCVAARHAVVARAGATAAGAARHVGARRRRGRAVRVDRVRQVGRLPRCARAGVRGARRAVYRVRLHFVFFAFDLQSLMYLCIA